VVFTVCEGAHQPLPYAKCHGSFVFARNWRKPWIKAGWTTWNDMQDLDRLPAGPSNRMGIYRLRDVQSHGRWEFSLPKLSTVCRLTRKLFPDARSSAIWTEHSSEEDQPGRNNEIILSHGLWTRRVRFRSK